MTKFFSKSNLHGFIWAIIGALICGVSGLLWNWWDGPAKVVVVNNKDIKDTTVTVVRVNSDSTYLKEIAQLLRQNAKANAKRAINSPKRDTNNQTRISNEITKRYDKLFDSLLVLATSSKESRPIDTTKKVVELTSSNAVVTATRLRKVLPLPSNVKGYTQGTLNGIAKISLGKTTFERKDLVEITIDFFKPKMLEEITPITVSLSEKTGERMYYQHLSEQYQLTAKTSKIILTADLKPKVYELSVGFYIKDDLTSQFPPFYHRAWTVTITD